MASNRDYHGKPASSWWGDTLPLVGPTGTATTWVGVQLKFTVSGKLAGFRQYLDTGFDGNLWAVIWDQNTRETFRAYYWRIRVNPSGGRAWHQTWIRPMLRIDTTIEYNLAVMFSGGHFFRNNTVLGAPVTHNDIQFVQSFQTTALIPPSASITYNTNANAVDALFYPD